jgi:hypothetical protein
MFPDILLCLFSNKSPSTHNLPKNRARGGLEEGRQEIVVGERGLEGVDG